MPSGYRNFRLGLGDTNFTYANSLEFKVVGTLDSDSLWLCGDYGGNHRATE
jgi:hypothetical protein